MPLASPALVDALWDSWADLQKKRAQPALERDYSVSIPPPSLGELRQAMRSYLAWAADGCNGRLSEVTSKQGMGAFLEGAEQLLVDRLDGLRVTVEKLEAMREEDFRWICRQEGFPKKDQAVIYYFDVVGAHPGRYRGLDTSEHGHGLDVFTGDFGGFLGGDVTHWVPRP